MDGWMEMKPASATKHSHATAQHSPGKQHVVPVSSSNGAAVPTCLTISASLIPRHLDSPASSPHLHPSQKGPATTAHIEAHTQNVYLPSINPLLPPHTTRPNVANTNAAAALSN